MKPLVSIVTLTYKKFDRIWETIRSVCEQTYSNIEYIICDDGSEAFPEDEINKYIDEKRSTNLANFVLLHKEKNEGTVRNINYAYMHGLGEYFINLSCGDVFYEHTTVEKLIARLQVSGKSLVLSSRVMYENDYSPLFLTPHKKERDWIGMLDTREKQYREFVLSHLYNMASGSVMCVSKEMISSFGYFDTNYLLLEDSPFFSKFFRKYTAELAPDIISIWYEAGGVSTGGKSQAYYSLLEDTKRFDKTEKMAYLNEFSEKEKRWIKYVNKRDECVEGKKKIFAIISYLPEYLRGRKKYADELKYRKEDLEFLRGIE
jgi:glycosyltransferase involved in cell wall biosynthesis